MTLRALPASFAIVLLAGDAFAQLPPGLYVSEVFNGSVINVEGGGNFSSAPRFATGLGSPFDLCRGPGNDLYVVEMTQGEVTVITAGGDFTTATPFAFGLSDPTGLLCTPTQILVAEYGSGEVTDITLGGDFSGAPSFASGLVGPADLLRDASNTLWASSDAGIYNITAGGDFSNAPLHVSGQAYGMTAWMGQLLVADTADKVRNFQGGGSVTSLPIYATVPLQVYNVAETPIGLFVTNAMTGVVTDITAGGDLSMAPPYATGLLGYTYGIVYETGCGNGIVQTGEQCDDMGETASCDADCTLVSCGDNTINATAGEQCDDGNTTGGDGCDASCMTEGTGGSGGGGGAGGAGGGGGTGGSGIGGTMNGGAGGMESTGAVGGTGDAVAASSSTTSSGTTSGGASQSTPPDRDDADGGCNCRAAGQTGSRVGLFCMAALFGLLIRRRSQRGVS